MDKKRRNLFLGIKAVGLVSYIPVILAVGPLAGYFAGKFLEERFRLPGWVSYVLMVIGFIAAMKETMKIISRLNSVDKIM